MAEVSAGTLYEINQNVMKNQPEMTKKQIEEKKNQIKAYFMDRIDNKYFMLLCKELSDYTVFIIPSTIRCGFAVKELMECFKNRGEIQSIETTEDDFALEIWIKADDESHVYYLFPYKNGIIEC